MPYPTPGFVVRQTFLEFEPPARVQQQDADDSPVFFRSRAMSDSGLVDYNADHHDLSASHFGSEELRQHWEQSQREPGVELELVRYLPKVVRGHVVLAPDDDDATIWRVLLSVNELIEKALWYRRSKNMHDSDFGIAGAPFGTVVRGIDDGDFVRVVLCQGAHGVYPKLAASSSDLAASCEKQDYSSPVVDDGESLDAAHSGLPQAPGFDQGTPLGNDDVTLDDPSPEIVGSSSPEPVEEPDMEPENGRTTLQVEGLPDGLNSTLFMEAVNSNGFENCYDFVYVPMDLVTGAPLGHALINFSSSSMAAAALDRFTGQWQWSPELRCLVDGQGHGCQASWSKYCQGLDALVERYRNSPVMHENMPDLCKPVILNAGRIISFPAPTRRVRMPRQRKKQQREAEANAQPTLAARSLQAESGQSRKPARQKGGSYSGAAANARQQMAAQQMAARKHALDLAAAGAWPAGVHYWNSLGACDDVWYVNLVNAARRG